MKRDCPDRFLKVSDLLEKLGELAEALDQTAKKMRFAVEKQRIALEHLGRPDREGRTVLDWLHNELRRVESESLGEMDLTAVKRLAQALIDANPDRHSPLDVMAYHEYVEFVCVDEFKKFRNLPAISPEEIQLCDWEELCDRFAAEC